LARPWRCLKAAKACWQTLCETKRGNADTQNK
jgi:hypothetical protein